MKFKNQLTLLRLAGSFSHFKDPHPTRIRVGYISPDFREHPVGFHVQGDGLSSKRHRTEHQTTQTKSLRATVPNPTRIRPANLQTCLRCTTGAATRSPAFLLPSGPCTMQSPRLSAWAASDGSPWRAAPQSRLPRASTSQVDSIKMRSHPM